MPSTRTTGRGGCGRRSAEVVGQDFAAAGLWAPSSRIIGSRSTTSKRPSQLTSRRPFATASAVRQSPRGRAPNNASAQAALSSWCDPQGTGQVRHTACPVRDRRIARALSLRAKVTAQTKHRGMPLARDLFDRRRDHRRVAPRITGTFGLIMPAFSNATDPGWCQDTPDDPTRSS